MHAYDSPPKVGVLVATNRERVGFGNPPFVPSVPRPIMQKKRASALQQAWGDKPCDHPAFAKEYDNGERTGNYICTQCGKTVTFREKAELVAARKG
jgi:hypothetical protein